MSRFLLNLRDQRARNETQSLTLTSTAIFVSRSPSTLKSTWDSRGAVSHSMAGSMIGDDDPADFDDEDEKDADLWRCDTHTSMGTDATCVGSVAHFPKERGDMLGPGDKEGVWAQV